MSVGNTNFQNVYTTTGAAGPWSFNWTYTEEAQVQVYLDNVLQSPSTYTVTKDLVNPGGSISFLAGSIPVASRALLIQRFSDTLQNDILNTNYQLPPATIVRMVDKLTIIAQQISAQITRSLALPLTTIGVSAALPAPVAGAIPAWNAAANAIQYITPIQPGLALLDQGPGNMPAYGPVTSAAGGNVIGSGASVVDNLAAFNNTSSGIIKDSGISVASLLSSVAAAGDPAVNGFRLSLHATNPYPGDIAGASTIYSIPYKGNKISLWDSALGAMITKTSGIISEAISAATHYFRPAYVYEFLNAGVPDLEIDWWAAVSSKAITNVTIASPCVVTCTSHGWSTGDKIGIRSGTGTGTVWTDPAMGLDQKEGRITVIDANTFSIEINTTGLVASTYGTATAYKVPATPTTGVTQIEGVWFKSGDRTRRLVGAFKTNGSGTIDNSSTSRRNLCNVDNKEPYNMKAIETTNSWSAPAGSILVPRTSSLQLGVNRLEFMLALTANASFRNFDASTSGPAVHALSLDRVSSDAPGAYSTCFNVQNMSYGSGYPQGSLAVEDTGLAAGSHFVQRLVLASGTSYVGTTFASNGGANSSLQVCLQM